MVQAYILKFSFAWIQTNFYGKLPIYHISRPFPPPLPAPHLLYPPVSHLPLGTVAGTLYPDWPVISYNIHKVGILDQIGPRENKGKLSRCSMSPTRHECPHCIPRSPICHLGQCLALCIQTWQSYHNMQKVVILLFCTT